MTPKILIHPGFHKTGTSSLQRAASALADSLTPRLQVMQTDDIRPAIHVARRHSIDPEDHRLAAFASNFAACLSQIDPTDPRPLLISAEALSGQIPGRKGIEAYDTAPDLLEHAVSVLHTHFGPKPGIAIWFTTRDPEAWKRSAYYQNLRSTRLTEDYDTYGPRLDRAARLDDVVAAVRDRLKDRATVTSTRIETCRDLPLGPLEVALDLLGIDKTGLAPQPSQNTQPQDAADRLLALNRSSMKDEELSRAKRDLLRRYRRKAEKRSKSDADSTD
ncbi:hypothetical protein [Roseovarius aestuariivivens]|uniref:hypothetical protein n=1 Tax=Roseovarius aestuariivivens TaxID=1888910 RepID=UPI001080D527|nr:hypothetical protein [Roseovarius aestuariivivens]